MMDFYNISKRQVRGITEIRPEFQLGIKSSDLMIRGGDFYAVWNEETGLWSTDENDVVRIVDRDMDRYVEQHRSEIDTPIRILYMRESSSGSFDLWLKYIKKQLRDSFHMLDEKLIFANDKTVKTDYASKRLSYPLQEGDFSSYDMLISKLYYPEERRKIEWAIGSIVAGDSKKNQKFVVLYGEHGTGKSTVIHIIEKLFDGYYSTFDAKALGSASNQFALESFKTNPLVAIQHDGDLSRIEDNTRLNSLVSHELMSVNEKHKSIYTNKFKSFLFMATNKPVQITDAKSGLIRRLIDVSPTGETWDRKTYEKLYSNIDFELGAIACHCLEVYLENPSRYDHYTPLIMMGASNDFYNFVYDHYSLFDKDDGVSLTTAWDLYGTYCEDARVGHKISKRVFKEELKAYFKNFDDRLRIKSGERARSYYSGFRREIFEDRTDNGSAVEEPSWEWDLKERLSLFDTEFEDCLAQYASDAGTPIAKWSNTKTKLSDLDTKEVHYVKVPENLIVIDFDIQDANGNKLLDANLEAASHWPATYTELSKSGSGVHLHYYWDGDVSKLQRVYAEHVEIKTFSGGASLRRKLTLCNAVPIKTINAGLPLKEESKIVNFDGIKSEKSLRTLIKNNLEKKYIAGTKPSIDLIYKDLESAYNSGLKYDVSDMRSDIFAFAAMSTHHADYCMDLVSQMRFKSESEPEDGAYDTEDPIVFFDVEVFPNLLLVNWKIAGEGNPVERMINPSPEKVALLVKSTRLVGFNCRRYDNHILYARMMGYDNQMIYELSQRIITKGDKSAFFGSAYNLSYTDVYDFSSTKQSLKKFEIELGIHHQELGMKWDEPVPEDLWEEVSEYCDNDVLATEAVFNNRKGDFTARKILSVLASMTVNDTTNTLTGRIIFGNNKNPQSQFNYRDMGELRDDDYILTDDFTLVPVSEVDFSTVHENVYYRRFRKDGDKIFPIFPGYTFEKGHSMYREEDPGEGGYVFATVGMHSHVGLLDIASMHPSSIVAEILFGPLYTQRFEDILQARIAIKHKDFDKVRSMMDGKLAPYLEDEQTADDLAQALKIAINSVYGLTSAKFPNPFKDPRNVDNIVAKRGALFMINLRHEVEAKGYTVVHIKTDSIKIANADGEIVDFVMKYGSFYGYTFEYEAMYEKMCLVNNAVYIAKYDEYGIRNKGGKHAGEWTATGTQFQVPYVLKTLFTHENIEFKDLCETKQVANALYLDMNEGLPEGEHDHVFVGKIGRFCPIKEGYGGGLLMTITHDRKTGEDKFSSATGSKGYRWLESEVVEREGLQDAIDLSYYNKQVDEAIKDISKYGDAEWFIGD